MCLDIAGGWLTRVPDVILHEHAVQTVIAAPKPTWMNHPPSPVCDDLPNTNTLVLERSRKLVIVRVNHRTGDTIPAPLLHGLGFGLGNGRGAVRRLTGRRWRNRLGSRRHRLFQRYDRIPSDRLSDLCHG